MWEIEEKFEIKSVLRFNCNIMDKYFKKTFDIDVDTSLSFKQIVYIILFKNKITQNYILDINFDSISEEHRKYINSILNIYKELNSFPEYVKVDCDEISGHWKIKISDVKENNYGQWSLLLDDFEWEL